MKMRGCSWLAGLQRIKLTVGKSLADAVLHQKVSVKIPPEVSINADYMHVEEVKERKGKKPIRGRSVAVQPSSLRTLTL
ncbi:hypothetical protein XENOCAPTIV_013595 [Xenoophorus captivus]|uniref:Uncharacterized protein n=1 Tax=Xenoophorus captivus TaxID=1517983 RepID=A0ABV0RKU5_9TELE